MIPSTHNLWGMFLSDTPPHTSRQHQRMHRPDMLLLMLLLAPSSAAAATTTDKTDHTGGNEGCSTHAAADRKPYSHQQCCTDMLLLVPHGEKPQKTILYQSKRPHSVLLPLTILYCCQCVRETHTHTQPALLRRQLLGSRQHSCADPPTPLN